MDRYIKTLEAIERWDNEPFSWGVGDCCQFTAHVVKYVTGQDYTSHFNYQSEEEAKRIFEPFGGLVGLFTELLGNTSEDFEAGDPVIVELPKLGEVAGIYVMEAAMVSSEIGMLRVPKARIISGWNLCLQ